VRAQAKEDFKKFINTCIVCYVATNVETFNIKHICQLTSHWTIYLKRTQLVGCAHILFVKLVFTFKYVCLAISSNCLINSSLCLIFSSTDRTGWIYTTVSVYFLILLLLLFYILSCIFFILNVVNGLPSELKVARFKNGFFIWKVNFYRCSTHRSKRGKYLQ
jgi:hypothetical protein